MFERECFFNAIGLDAFILRKWKPWKCGFKMSQEEVVLEQATIF